MKNLQKRSVEGATSLGQTKIEFIFQIYKYRKLHKTIIANHKSKIVWAFFT